MTGGIAPLGLALVVAIAQEKPLDVQWQGGPVEGKLGDVAVIAVGEANSFIDGAGTRRILESWQNITDGSELGMVRPSVDDPRWFACFEFDRIGKVEDGEKIDPGEIFESMKSNEEGANEARKERGFEPLELVRWTTPPHYDAQTHNLEWGLLLRAPSGDSVNYMVKVLGRYGCMKVTLLCDPAKLDASLPEFREMLAGFEYAKGKSYAEWKQGDPVAEIGMTALITGGVGVAAWKLGLLPKLLKFAKFAAVAVLAGGAAIWKKLTGRGKRAAP